MTRFNLRDSAERAQGDPGKVVLMSFSGCFSVGYSTPERPSITNAPRQVSQNAPTQSIAPAKSARPWSRHAGSK